MQQPKPHQDKFEPGVSENKSGFSIKSLWAQRTKLTILILLFSLIPNWLFTKNSYFFQDDFIFLKEAKTSRLSLHYLASPVFQHFSPAYRFINFLAIRFFGMDYTKYHLVELSIWAVSVASFAWAISIIVTKDLNWTVIVLVFAQSLGLMHILIWWTATANIGVSIALSVLVLGCYFRYRELGKRYWAVLSLIIYFFALFTHEQVWLILGYIVLLDVLVFNSTLTFIQRIKHCVQYWIPFILFTAGAGINYFTQYYAEVKPSPTVFQMIQYFIIQLIQAFVPSITGIRYWSQQSSTGILYKPSEPLYLLSYLLGIIVILALVTYSSWGSAKQLKPWIVFAIAYATSSIMVGIDRVGLFGVNFGLVADYIADMTWLFLFCLALALRTKESRNINKNPTKHSRTKIWFFIILILGFETSLYYSAYLQNTYDFEFQLARESQLYTTNVINSLHKLKGQPYSLLSGQVPNAVLGSIFVPYNQLNSFLSLYDLHPRFNELTPFVYEVNSDGNLVRVNFDSNLTSATQGLHESFTSVGLGSQLCSSKANLYIPSAVKAPLNGDLWAEVNVNSAKISNAVTLNFSYNDITNQNVSLEAYVTNNSYPILVNLNTSAITNLSFSTSGNNYCISSFNIGIFKPKA